MRKKKKLIKAQFTCICGMCENVFLCEKAMESFCGEACEKEYRDMLAGEEVLRKELAEKRKRKNKGKGCCVHGYTMKQYCEKCESLLLATVSPQN
jgi:hypothetical protein